jgi:hypothetical protein
MCLRSIMSASELVGVDSPRTASTNRSSPNAFRNQAGPDDDGVHSTFQPDFRRATIAACCRHARCTGTTNQAIPAPNSNISNSSIRTLNCHQRRFGFRECGMSEVRVEEEHGFIGKHGPANCALASQGCSCKRPWSTVICGAEGTWEKQPSEV